MDNPINPESAANTSTNTTYWFKRRRYGWGWIPSTARGWLSLGLFVGALSLPKLVMSEDMRKGTAGRIWTWGLSAAYLAFVWSRGPKPKWRWGKRSDDNPLEDA